MVKKHKQLLLKCRVSNAPTSTEFIEEWLRELVSAIDMKILMGPFATYCDVEGNEGLTGLVAIETGKI